MIVFILLMISFMGCSPIIKDNDTSPITKECTCFNGEKVGTSYPSNWDVYENCECIDGIYQN